MGWVGTERRKLLADVMTPDEVAEMLQATSATVRKAIRDGRLPAEKQPSGVWHVRRSDIEDLIAQTSTEPDLLPRGAGGQ